MMHYFQILPVLLLVLAESATVDSHVLRGFQTPGTRYKPKFRYWLPDASADIDWVVKDIEAIAEVGAGGFEWLPYYQLGGNRSVDWARYGYGTDAFLQLNRAAFQAAADRDLTIDFSVGANQGQGVPSEVESPGLAVHLTYVNVSIEAGDTFSSVLPLSKQPYVASLAYFMHECEEFGHQNLSFVHAVEVISERDGVVTLGNVLDVSDQVNPQERSLTWSPPINSNSTWRIMAWYERYTNQRSIDGGNSPSNYVQNGSWIVDHFSAAGSRKMTDFYDDLIIPRKSDREMVAQIGNYAWEDSMEAMSGLWWTPKFASRFKKGRGYDITTCIPFLVVKQNYWASSSVPYGESFAASKDNQMFANKCIDDYRLTLQQGYREYLESNVAWAHSRGLKYSCQPAYNLPLSMPDSIPLVDGPELESLGFENADSYRQGAGPIHLTNNPILSSEAGAISGSVYTQTIRDLLDTVHVGLAGGISMNVFHGFPYSGPFFNTSWPGFAIFSYVYTEMWTPRQPAWRHLNDTMDYVTRNQFALQIGKPQVDIAIIKYQPRVEKPNPYDLTALERIGYTYEYLTPGNLELPEAVVSDELLAPHGPAYQAIVFLNQTKITLRAAKKVEHFASSGLPIFFVESTDFTSVGQRATEASEVAHIMMNIISSGLRNVVTVPSFAQLETALLQAQITPRTAFVESMSTEELWYTFRRKIDTDDLVWILNNGSAANTVHIKFANTKSKTPYILNAWTGQILAALDYVTDDQSIIIPITLSVGETVMYAFISEESQKLATDIFPTGPEVVVTSSKGVKDFSYYTDCGKLALVASIPRGEALIELSSGQRLQYSVDVPKPTVLNLWNITIQSWRGSDDYEKSGKTTIDFHEYTGVSLKPWKDLDPAALSHVSGVGDYGATFITPGAPKDMTIGAYLHLGELSDSSRIWLNQKIQQPIQTIHGDLVLDLTKSLAEPGASNTIHVETASTLYNALRGNPDDFFSAGITASLANSAFFEANGAKPYGLAGPVWIEWVQLLVVP